MDRLLLGRYAASLLLAMLSFGPTLVRAQAVERVGTGGFGFSAGLQRYDLGELNAALRNQGFPVLAENTARVSLFVSRRYPGRLKSTFGFYTENFEIPDDVPPPGFTFSQLSTRAGAAGISYALDVDLFYPSAWNVYVGASVDAGGLRLVTSSVNERGFAGNLVENKFTVGTLGVSPRVTAETIEINTKAGGFRVIGSVGYRFGVSQPLDRENFTTQEPGVEIEPTGANWQLGVVATIK